ncbi:hypothetical protein [Actinomycetospora lemnae]|uniref:Yip1 domain-containing protein n=1 Tax=Actinomycetospora lemnae TaxID=3019891 RepID=A0ABT5SUQ9_9PSEU|nr:hypothetical protein [Actinomycetospora sp. DW7H6]MDD7965896.1 hypothetical protein [Actinomycetospora sp. DW7H6]
MPEASKARTETTTVTTTEDEEGSERVMPPAAEPASPWVPILLGVYLLIVAVLSGRLLIDVWARNFALYRSLLGTESLTGSQVAVVTPLTYTVVGGVFGAVIVSFQGLHLHAAVRRNFQTSYGGSYLVGPWVAALIALAAYALVKGGLLVFSGGDTSNASSTSSNWAFLSLGILTGFSWLKVLQKLNSLADQFFAVGRPPQSGPPAGTSDTQ